MYPNQSSVRLHKYDRYLLGDGVGQVAPLQDVVVDVVVVREELVVVREELVGQALVPQVR